MRAQGSRRLPEAAHHPERLPERFDVHPPIAREPNGKYEQLGTSLGAFALQALNGPESKPDLIILLI